MTTSKKNKILTSDEHTEHISIDSAQAQIGNLANKVCPNCGAVGQFTEPMPFNLMFETKMGANVDDSMTLYLRPETAQGIFVNFRNVLDSGRVKIPFGIAQIGKSFRNEVTTKAFIFRTREFEQAEIEFFCEPGTDEKWYQHWRQQRFDWYINLGIKKENLHFREHSKGRAGTLCQGLRRCRIQVSLWLGRLAGAGRNRQPHRL